MKSKKGHKGETKTAAKVPILMNQSLLTDIRDLILSVRRQVAQAVNAGLTMLYWEIGRRIRQDILPHMGELTPLANTMSEEKKFAVIQREFDRLYDRRHPVRNQVETLDSVEVVKINRDVLNR